MAAPRLRPEDRDQAAELARRVGDRIRSARMGRRGKRHPRQPDMTQVELAEKIGVSVATIERIEKGRSPDLSLYMVLRIARTLGVGLERLVDGLPRMGGSA